ncbi:MAG: hypothetical protein ACTH1W_04340 [Advenella sp.]
MKNSTAGGLSGDTRRTKGKTKAVKVAGAQKKHGAVFGKAGQSVYFKLKWILKRAQACFLEQAFRPVPSDS